jgi:Zn-dependent metalloprotease
MTKDILAFMKPVAAELKHRIVFDANNGTQLPGTVVRQEGEPPVTDVAVNEAYDGSGDHVRHVLRSIWSQLH